MKRAVPSFTVEVRRRPRLVTKSGHIEQSLEAKIRPTASESDSYRLAAAEIPRQSSHDANAGYQKGRILPSLVPELPFQDAPSSAAASRRRKPSSVRALRGKDYASKLSRSLEALPELTAQLADRSPIGSVRSSVVPIDGTAVLGGGPSPTANLFAGNSSGPPPSRKARRRAQIPTAHDASSVPISAQGERSITRIESSKAPATAVDDASRPKRKRTIMGRYVFGDELKPR